MNEIRETLPHPRTRVEVVYAGGTISSLATTQGYREGGHVVDLVGRLEEKLPNFREGFEVGKAEVVYTGLSENMDEEYWEQIEGGVTTALDRDPNAVLITHGTDSMEQTARRLQRRLKDLLAVKNAKIIVTGANDDLSHPQTDAWDNLDFAFQSTKNDAEPGVYVAFHKRLIPADLVVKEPFNGSEMNYVSMEDPEYIEAVKAQEAESNDLIVRLQRTLGPIEEEGAVVEYPVNVIRANHEAFIDQLNTSDIRSVLLILYHSGTANTEKPELSVSDLVRRLREDRGIVFFGVTENGEPVDLHSYETSVRLREAGVVPLYDMPKDVALAKLRLLYSNLPVPQLIREMLRNRVGEIDERKTIPEDIDQLVELYSEDHISFK